jgi:enoyl-CoA hydratase
VTLGLLPGNGGTQRLPRLVGPSRALDLMVTGRTLTPSEAFELGLLDRLYPAEDLEAATREYAEQLAAGATKAIGNIKLAIWAGLESGLKHGLEREQSLIEELFQSEDGREGVAAFAEKRKPAFKGA